MERSWLWVLISQLDGGDIRVGWANYQVIYLVVQFFACPFLYFINLVRVTLQIIQSVSWSLDVDFPSPFKEMLGALSFFSFDFLSFECLFQSSNQMTSVYIYSAAPLLVAAMLVSVHAIRGGFSADASSQSTASLTFRLMLLTYLVLPPCTLKQVRRDISSALSCKYDVIRSQLVSCLVLSSKLWIV
jgi:hypothetical protein